MVPSLNECIYIWKEKCGTSCFLMIEPQARWIGMTNFGEHLMTQIGKTGLRPLIYRLFLENDTLKQSFVNTEMSWFNSRRMNQWLGEWHWYWWLMMLIRKQVWEPSVIKYSQWTLLYDWHKCSWIKKHLDSLFGKWIKDSENDYGK